MPKTFVKLVEKFITLISPPGLRKLSLYLNMTIPGFEMYEMNPLRITVKILYFSRTPL